MQKCLDERVFPEVWKRQWLLQFPKTGKPPGYPSAYRPICLIDTAGKVLEKNVMYDVVLRLKLTMKVALTGLADDITLEVYSELIEEAELTIAHPVDRSIRGIDRTVRLVSMGN